MTDKRVFNLGMRFPDFRFRHADVPCSDLCMVKFRSKLKSASSFDTSHVHNLCHRIPVLVMIIRAAFQQAV